MDANEEFLQFLDPDLCTLEETHETGSLRTLTLDYKFQDLVEDKQLFKIGNKVWIQGDTNLTDTLYVINTEVTQDIYKENSFNVELEEVLVELNYAPLFSQTELTTAVDPDGHKIFRLVTSNGRQEVYVDWNALNYWFGDYFNMGVVQECISAYASRISITGTINRMTLLRQIEEETGNIFVTRYEKDVINNTIHRYLDFLNPINISKDWLLNLEYDFHNNENTAICYDENGNITTEDTDTEVKRYENTEYGPEEVDEDTELDPDEDDYDVEQTDPYIPEDQELYDYDKGPDYTPIVNLNPSHCDFRITNGKDLLDINGRISDETEDPLLWNCTDVGFVDTDYPSYFISLQKKGNQLGITINNKSYCVSGVGVNPACFIAEMRNDPHGQIAMDYTLEYTTIPDDSYFEIYNHNSNVCLYRTRLNTQIGHVHEEILDFGFNLENIEYTVDETETYTAVAPVLKLSEDNSGGKTLSRTDIDTVINRWINLDIPKGSTVPMIVEKVNITGTDASPCVQRKGTPTSPNRSAEQILGSYSRSANYWQQPLKPTDQLESTNKSYEYYRAIAYWSAPYAKHSGEMHVSTDKALGVGYTNVYTRPDTRQERTGIQSPKLGNTETTDEDIYAIYNQVAMYLKEHEEPNINIEVDVANLIGHEYNNYQLHDKIYLKLANTRELITARVTKTTKEAHDVAKNTIEISNYKNVNTIKTIQHETHIDANGVSFKYPNTHNLQVRLCNSEYDSEDPTSGEAYLFNKLVTFTLYKVENGSSTFTGKVYTKITNANGYANLNLKLDPGDYELSIRFGGDEEYTESEITIKVNVSGTKEVVQEQPKTSSNKSKSKTTKKTTKKKYKTVKTYWDKLGRSPDKKKLLAIGRISAPGDKGSYANFYEREFKNKCPYCGKATLTWAIFTAGNEYANYGKWPSTGVIEGSSAEGAIHCDNCDSDYSIQGNEHINGGRKLKALTPVKKSSKSKAYKLKKGKLQYGTKKVLVTPKKTANNKDRYIRAKNIAPSVKKKALSIVGNSTGQAALMKIVAWIDKTSNLAYHGYTNFQRSPAVCITKKGANCCDGTRLFFQLCDAAGLCEYYNFYYVHVQCPKFGHVYGIVETKSTKKWRYVDTASDTHGCWGYVCQTCPHGNRTSKYPNLPFG